MEETYSTQLNETSRINYNLYFLAISSTFLLSSSQFSSSILIKIQLLLHQSKGILQVPPVIPCLRGMGLPPCLRGKTKLTVSSASSTARQQSCLVTIEARCALTAYCLLPTNTLPPTHHRRHRLQQNLKSSHNDQLLVAQGRKWAGEQESYLFAFRGWDRKTGDP